MGNLEISIRFSAETDIFPFSTASTIRAGRSGDRIPVEARFSASIQTGSETHPASCTMGTVSFPGARQPRRDADHPPPSIAEVHRRE